MVILLPQSGISAEKYPKCAQWDRLCRKHYSNYQKLIDDQTYAIQRARGSWFSKMFYPPYPNLFLEEIYEVKMLKNKQMVGEILQEEVQIYQSVKPNIIEYVNKVFSIKGIDFPFVGFIIGVPLFSLAHKLKIPASMKLIALLTPVISDYIYNKRLPKDSIVVNEFLEWIIEYRKNRCLMELNREQFQTAEAQKALGEKQNMVQLGQTLVQLALSKI